jgi:hypothetical protein
MLRRRLLIATAAWPTVALAHHGWSSFDLGRPLWLEGSARRVAWRNPHAELDLELAADLRLPPDLARRPRRAPRSMARRSLRAPACPRVKTASGGSNWRRSPGCRPGTLPRSPTASVSP